MAGNRTGNRAYRRNRAIVLRNNNVCHICGFTIDLDVKAPDPMSASVDHIVAYSNGGDDSVNNLRAAHLGCNQKRYNKDISQVDIRHTGGIEW